MVHALSVEAFPDGSTVHCAGRGWVYLHLNTDELTYSIFADYCLRRFVFERPSVRGNPYLRTRVYLRADSFPELVGLWRSFVNVSKVAA